jgi:hypothetical protein
MTDDGRVVVTIKDAEENAKVDKVPMKQNNNTKENIDKTQWTPRSPNSAPKADAGRDKIAREDTVVILDGSKSRDRKGEIVSYGWEQLSGPVATLEHPEAPMTSFIAPSVERDTFVAFKLTVTNNIGKSSSDVVVVRITNYDELGTSRAEPGDKPEVLRK